MISLSIVSNQCVFVSIIGNGRLPSFESLFRNKTNSCNLTVELKFVELATIEK